MSKATSEKQPLINQRATLRMGIGLLIIAGLIFGYQWYRREGTDIYGSGEKNTAGAIAAVELKDRGSQIVVIWPNGEIEGSPGHTAGASERDFTWRPDGNQIFFSGNREGSAYNIYRWNLAMDHVEARTFGKLGRTAPSFPASPNEEGKWTLLMTSGGSAWELDPANLVADQVVPFEENSQQSTREDQESGDADVEMSAAKHRIRKAMWTKDRKWIVAVRRTETGEALLLQSMTGATNTRTPVPLAFGDKIEFDVNAQTGKVVYTVTNFQWPDPSKAPDPFIQDGKARKKYLHAIHLLDPEDPTTWGYIYNIRAMPPENPAVWGPIIADNQNDKLSFDSPKLSPDGSTLLITAGTYQDGTFIPRSIVTMPAEDKGGFEGAAIVKGEVYEPSWHPNGNSVVFIRKEGGKRHIYTVNKDGSGEKRMSDGQKSYAFPQFSPQSK